MKNKLLLASSFLGVAVLAVPLLSSPDERALSAAHEACSGYHYSGKAWNAGDEVAYGKGANGLYEYWHCCVCHEYYLSKDDIPGGYQASLWEEGKVASKASSSSSRDPRVQFGGSEVIHEINPLSAGTISVDGSRDEAYNGGICYEFASSGATKATLETLYQGDMLYVYVSVEDSTKAKRDFSVPDSSSIDSYDSVELRIDALHSEEDASSSWDGKQGESYYSGDDHTKYSSVGRFLVSAGYAGEAEGSEFDSSYPLSSLCGGDGKSSVRSAYADDTHYGAEFAIYLGDSSTILNPFGEIGLAVKVNDNSAKGVSGGALYFESVNQDMDHLRCYSSFRLKGYSSQELESGKAIAKSFKGDHWWTFGEKTISTANADGCVVSSSSYGDFSALLQFDGISTNSSHNPYFDKTARKCFLFGGDIDEHGDYQGFGLSASCDWFQILSISGTKASALSYANIAPSGVKVRLRVKNGAASLEKEDGTVLIASTALSGYSAGKLGLLRNEDVVTTLTVHSFSSDSTDSSSANEGGASLVNDMKANSSWNIAGNRVKLNTKGYCLSSASYNDFSATFQFTGVSRSGDAEKANPFFSHKATKGFLFGGSKNASGAYQGYALNVSYDWFEILKLDGYSSTFVDGFNIDPEGVGVRLSMTGTTCRLTKADGTSLGNSFNNQTEIALSDYAGGKIGAMMNDGCPSLLTIYDFAS